jgi:hypothetical protein
MAKRIGVVYVARVVYRITVLFDFVVTISVTETKTNHREITLVYDDG